MAEPVHEPRSLTICPDKPVLQAFHDGLLSFPVLRQITGHLAECTTCLAEISHLHSQPLTSGNTTRLLQRLACLRGRSGGYLPLPMEVENPPYPNTPRLKSTLGDEMTLPLPEPEASPRQVIGDVRIGRYLLMKKLGEGGMGVVYLAREERVGLVVALKMIAGRASQSMDCIRRFQTEGRALSRIRHTNVVQFYHFDEHQSLPYYTMEYVEGENLQRRLRRGPLGIQMAADLTRTLALAIAYVHQKGVLHRDLKPANILFNEEGVPKIADFGLAKLMDTNQGQTLTEGILGTTSYMSPEQASGMNAYVSYESDIYSLGAIFYAMLTGKPPFVGLDRFETLRLVTMGKLIPPSRYRSEIPRDLEEICCRCLQVDPADRYDSAEKLAVNLGDWLSGNRPRDNRGWIIRRSQRLRFVALAIITLSVILGVGAWGLRDRASSRTPDSPNVLQSESLVTLIGRRGKPHVLQWLEGEKETLRTLAEDGCYSLSTWGTALVELLPDPRAEEYQLTAQIRHEKSDPGEGSVGLYIARQEMTVLGNRVDCLLRISFDDIHPPRSRMLHPGDSRAKMVRFTPWLYSIHPKNPRLDLASESQKVASFTHSGESKNVWRTLHLTVTPEAITITWENQKPLRISRSEIEKQIQRPWERLKGKEQLEACEPAPGYEPRGGLGLYLKRGAASFRNVYLTRGGVPQ